MSSATKNAVFNLLRTISYQDSLKGRKYIKLLDISPDEIKVLFSTARVLKNTPLDEMHIIKNKKILCLLHEPCWKIQTWLYDTARLLNIAIDTIIYPHWDTKWNVQDTAKVLSQNTNIIFCQAARHFTLEKFSKNSEVSVVNISSCRFLALPVLADLLTLEEYFTRLEGLTVACIGSACPLVNTYLELCPQFGIHVKFITRQGEPVSPSCLNDLRKRDIKFTQKLTECKELKEVISGVNAVITTTHAEQCLMLKKHDLDTYADKNWVFLHHLPRSQEVDDEIFQSNRNLLWVSFKNTKFVCSAIVTHFLGINKSDFIN